MYNCKEATILLQKKQQRQISVAERCRLFFHLLLCKACRLFAKQSALIDKHLHDLPSSMIEKPAHTLTASAKSRMQTLLDKEEQ